MENMILCKERLIEGANIRTPLLIPSFSSKGIENSRHIFNMLKPYITDVTLFSAYDLYYDFFDKSQIYETEILFIDSGGYEAGLNTDLSENRMSFYFPEKWKEEFYLDEIQTLKKINNLILVNYDYPNTSIEQQIDKANAIFSRFPEYHSDFLIKSESENGMLNVKSLLSNLNLCSRFSILGFTEKELGNSVYERCKNLYLIRKEMNKLGLDKPIHIFGCLDPLNIIIYFLCGADIFDGLSWLRFGFKYNQPIYINSYAISEGKWKYSNEEIKVMTFFGNLNCLKELTEKMQQYANEKDLSVFNLDEQFEKEIIEILNLLYEEVGI
ncbi:hypothetical protein [Lysinibacillus xylanilyticus]|uniref:hypothetical protein n=1 Tax=Lysinibacillus xylanilyticus TaxID=582475 RepID=UPI0038255CCE